jgi:hypothetical protein
VSLDLELSSKQPSAMFIELLGQHALIVAHVAISMNFNKIQHVSKNQKKGQIIKTLTLKQKMKRHFTKRDGCISEGGKQQIASSFSFSANKFLSFFVSKMSAKEIFVEKLQR